MCHSDVAPMQYEWSESAQTVQGQMQNLHMCRNFEKIKHWAFERWLKVNRTHYPFTWMSAKSSEARVP